MRPLTVKDVIEHLKTLPQDSICVTTNSNTMEQSGDELMNLPVACTTGSVSKASARDAFDGTPYSYDQYSTVGGKLNMVKF